MVVVYVLFIGQRKTGSKGDPYERAVQALARADSDAIEAMRLLITNRASQGCKAEGPAIPPARNGLRNARPNEIQRCIPRDGARYL
jgi:hypothetical protein